MRCSPLLHLTLSLSLGLFAACGNRSLPGTDGGHPPGDGVSPPADTGPRQDGSCVRPPGGCFGPQDCPANQDCKGCHADPCCPMCAVCYGTCVSSGECWDNKDCPGGQFCQLDGGDCGKTKPGVCSTVPSVCADGGYNPVCGCDGKTYMSPCDAHAVKISVASVGPCDQQGCLALDAAYVKALDQARTCCATCESSLQCTQKINTGLACSGCGTYVESSNSTALQTIKSLVAQWSAMGCDKILWSCPGYACPPIIGGGCGAAGKCQDTLNTP